MTIWEKLKSWLTDEQYSEVESAKDELKDTPQVEEVKEDKTDSVEMDTEAPTTPQDSSETKEGETTPTEEEKPTESETEPTTPVEEVKAEDKHEEVRESDVESQTGVVLEDGWLGADGVADLEKIKDEDLKKYIEGLIAKSTVSEQTEHGFNPTVPSANTGYVPGMSFEEALSLEYQN